MKAWCSRSSEDKSCIVVENNNWSLGTNINERRQELILAKLSEAIGFNIHISIDDGTSTILSKVKSARENALYFPQIIECEIKTIGGNQNAARGYVSYHHGPIRENIDETH